MPRKLSKSLTSPSSTTLSSTTTSSSTLNPASTLPPSLADPTLPLPRLIVFDLDYTLWPFWVDTHVSPPLKPSPTHTSATDKFGEEFAFYADVPWILQLLPHAVSSSSSSGFGSDSPSPPSAPIKMGIASRTSAPQLARDLLKMLHLPALQEGDRAPRRAIDVFDGGTEIYPGSKMRHFEAIQKKTGVKFEDMLFFDDESRNGETEKLGLTMRLVRDGLCWDEVEKGVEEWRRRRGFRRGSASTG